MLATTVAAIHPHWPEAQRERWGQGMKSAGLAVWVFGREKKKNCLARCCRSISSGRNDKKQHLSQCDTPQ